MHKIGKCPLCRLEARYISSAYQIKEHNNLFDDEMISEIRQSRAVVAEFTGQRAGVYYEARFARGLGLEVVPSVRQDEMNACHFDTNHLNHILWSGAADLPVMLKNRLVATLGRGSIALPGRDRH